MFANYNPTQYDNTVKERKNKRAKRKSNNSSQQSTSTGSGLKLKRIEPKTKNQFKTFDEYQDNNHCVLHGVAGTGKTFISLYLALDEIFNAKQKQKIICIRSVVPTRDIGFLPGNEKEKSKVYEMPYANICNDLFCRGDAYEILKSKKQFEFMTSSFLRGMTFNDAIVLIDEAQNLSFHELDTIITRLGKNCRLIVAGDFRQSDLVTNGLLSFLNIIKRMRAFSFVEFNVNDIVRSGIVKEYLTIKHTM
jgi:phosphate starvation-inducible PhoH-like protein